MNTVLIAFILAAGVGAFVYSRIGRRIGYGNAGDVWKVVIGSFIGAFVFFLTLFAFVVHYKGF